jgi:hypothetical protein
MDHIYSKTTQVSIGKSIDVYDAACRQARNSRGADSGSLLMKTNTNLQTKVASLQSPVADLLQRRCACGNHTIAGGECEACKPQGALQRAGVSQSPASDVSPATVMKSGLARDFSGVPAHSKIARRLQTKLTVNTPGDIYEQEADAMADKVMRMSVNQSSRLKQHQSQTKPVPENSAPVVQTKSEAGQDGAAVSDELSEKIASSQGGGSKMDGQTQSFMQSRFGMDFSRVKIHTDGEAARLSRQLNAQAFTIGHDIYFDSGKYAPASESGKRLLAHELTHTIQQGHSRARRQYVEPFQHGETGREEIPDEKLPLEQMPDDDIEPKIQRSTTWAGAAVHETLNAAEIIMGGDSPVSWQMLNGTMLKTVAEADASIKQPTLTTAVGWKATVDLVPAQTGSDDETVLSPGPWSTVVPKADVGAKTGIAACAGAGDSTFSAKGKPSDNSVYKANRRHENHHVADDKKAFKDTVGKWDKKLEKAKKKGTEFKGATEAAATAALWAAMGGTPEEVSRAYRTLSFTKGGDYHLKPKGGPMTTSNPVANADCSVSSEELRNPA